LISFQIRKTPGALVAGTPLKLEELRAFVNSK